MSTAVLMSPTCTRALRARRVIDLEPAPASAEEIRQMYLEPGTRRQPALRRGAFEQGRLAVDFRTCEHDPSFGPQATPTSALPDPHAWIQRMLPALLECVSGQRQPRQLVRWLTQDCHDRVVRRFATAQRRGRALTPPSVRRIRVCSPYDGVAEVSAVVVLEGRARAVALRLNGADGRWVITELAIG